MGADSPESSPEEGEALDPGVVPDPKPRRRQHEDGEDHEGDDQPEEPGREATTAIHTRDARTR